MEIREAAAGPLAARCLQALRRRGLPPGGALLVCGAAPAFAALAKQQGFAVSLSTGAPAQAFDAALLFAPSPDSLPPVHAVLRPAAPVLLAVPGLSSPARETLHSALLRCGFNRILADSRAGLLTALRAEIPVAPKCSIIIAAYNERRSFPVLMDALLKLQLPCARELIVVESNSTDGTRELLQAYQSHPDVRVILQDRPRGKGHAIREGLRHVSGDIVLFQDADLEYDLNDYQVLLAPLLSGQALFVLGTRHAGNWKMRRFTTQPALAAAMNFGHLFFTGLINLLYGQKMSDPFTMFKVFHRDCLYGLRFSCNRFDFDHELVIKFLRKGYVPLEIPVNYSSRSFREGKKIRVFRDPFLWLWTDIKLRFTRLYPDDPA